MERPWWPTRSTRPASSSCMAFSANFRRIAPVIMLALLVANPLKGSLAFQHWMLTQHSRTPTSNPLPKPNGNTHCFVELRLRDGVTNPIILLATSSFSPSSINHDKHAITEASSVPPQHSSQGTPVQGILQLHPNELEYANQLHRLIKELQQQIPNLLRHPLTDIAASRVYCDSIRLVVGGDNTRDDDDSRGEETPTSAKTAELTSTRTELVRLSNTLFWANAMSIRARQLWTRSTAALWWNLATSPTAEMELDDGAQLDGTMELPIVQAIVVLNLRAANKDREALPRVASIEVHWQVDLLQSAATMSADSTSSKAIGDKSQRARPNNIFQGVSLLLLDDEDTGKESHGSKGAIPKVHTMQLQRLAWNGQATKATDTSTNEIDADSLGRQLAALRQTVKSLQQSPLLQPLLGGFMSSSSSTASLLDQVREEWMQQFLATTDGDNSAIKDESLLPPIYVHVMDPDAPALEMTRSMFLSGCSPLDSAAVGLILVDDYFVHNSTDNGLRFPIPGSKDWPAYSALHQMAIHFANKIIPALSTPDNLPAARSLIDSFASDAVLMTNGNTLLQGSRSLANFYQALALWRERSGGTWKVRQTALLPRTSSKNKNNGNNPARPVQDGDEPWIWADSTSNTGTVRCRLQVDYETTMSFSFLPAGVAAAAADDALVPTAARSSSFVALGKDVFHIKSSSTKNDAMPLIERVDQLELTLRDGTSRNAISQDATWLMRALATASETGRLRSMDEGSAFWMDILQRLSGRITSNRVAAKALPYLGPDLPHRSDRAALTLYRMMESLHRDLYGLVGVDGGDDNEEEGNDPRSRSLPPAAAFLHEDISLVNTFDQTLLRGRSNYVRTLRLSIASFQAAVRSGRIIIVPDNVRSSTNSNKNKPIRPIRTKVELTASGNVRCTWTMTLTIAAPPPPQAVLNVMQQAGMDRTVSSPPLKSPPITIQVVSDYVPCDDNTGMILRHVLVESRINGQLTPGDLLAQMLQRMLGLTSSRTIEDFDFDRNDGGASRSVISDALQWLWSL